MVAGRLAQAIYQDRTYVRNAEDVSFGSVVRLMEGPLALLPCVSETQYRRCADCADERACELRRIFRSVRDSTAAILDDWTLADAGGKAGPQEIYINASTPKKSSRRSAVKRSSGRAKGLAKQATRPTI